MIRHFESGGVHHSFQGKLIVHNVFLESLHAKVGGGNVHPGDEGGGGLRNNKDPDAPGFQCLHGFGHQGGLPGTRASGDHDFYDFPARLCRGLRVGEGGTLLFRRVADDEKGGQGNGAPSLRVVQIFTHSLVAAVPAAAYFRNLVNLPKQYRTG